MTFQQQFALAVIGGSAALGMISLAAMVMAERRANRRAKRWNAAHPEAPIGPEALR